MFGVGLLIAALVQPSPPMYVKPVWCDFWYGDAISYAGPCVFEPKATGSFLLTFTDNEITKKVGYVEVQIGRDGYANVTDAISSWGHAIRSKKDRACWIGREFRVCAYE